MSAVGISGLQAGEDVNDLQQLAHQPVLLNEAIHALNIRADGRYVDGTLGRAGHTRNILAQLNNHGRLLALDRDPSAGTVLPEDARSTFVQRPFSRLQETLIEQGWDAGIDGVLLDLGVSSPQLNDAQRGFSFSRNGPLDMRMDPTSGLSAAAWLAQISEMHLGQVLRDFGEERFYRRVARAIINARQESVITSTGQLAEIVAAAIPTREPHQHPATRTFQAIRIAVNDELGELRTVLPQIVSALNSGGRMVIISFHSLEDRMVKQFMREQARGRELPLDLPVTGKPEGITLSVIGRPIRPSAEEVAANPRARSAILRIAEKL